MNLNSIRTKENSLCW